MTLPGILNRDTKSGLISSFHSQSSAILNGSGSSLAPGFLSNTEMANEWIVLERSFS